MTCKNLTRRIHAIQEYGARVAVVVDNQERCRMVGGLKRQRYAAFVAYFKRFQRGYGKLQVALPAPNVVNHHVRAYGAVILDRDETCIAGLFVCYSDAELIIVSAKELHFARPLVIQWGYGMLWKLSHPQNAAIRPVVQLHLFVLT